MQDIISIVKEMNNHNNLKKKIIRLPLKSLSHFPSNYLDLPFLHYKK